MSYWNLRIGWLAVASMWLTAAVAGMYSFFIWSHVSKDLPVEKVTPGTLGQKLDFDNSGEPYWRTIK